MVYSTLHTNTAVGAVTRLMDLGVDRFLVASVLRLVAAQRLVRTLCKDCRQPGTISRVEALALQAPHLEGEGCYHETGCLSCAGKGYRGRTGLFELLPIRAEQSAVISGALQGGSIEQALIELRDEMGNLSMRESGLKAISEGISTVSEVIKTTSEFV
jgi:type II secretory ATPase GspE/PulE/Tfp pilus assembly ATPase PilB-like protein